MCVCRAAFAIVIDVNNCERVNRRTDKTDIASVLAAYVPCFGTLVHESGVDSAKPPDPSNSHALQDHNAPSTAIGVGNVEIRLPWTGRRNIHCLVELVYARLR